ncbi:MAG: fused MFS/spermidine synthase [Verrucomicrobia bacterium]|nr:fused MFS/spermidine synthase [Verrucomicrobiota bacterium]
MLATGLLGIGFEVVGVRLLKGVLENTVFTFASVLAVYLVGTALGAAWAGRVAPRQPFEAKLAWLLGALGVTCAVGGWAIVMAPEVYRGLRVALGDSLGGVMVAEGLVAASVFVLPTLFMGATFATLAEAVRDQRGSVGRALAWNTVGGMLAPLLVGPLLFPWLGGKWTLVVLVGGYTLWRMGQGSWRLPQRLHARQPTATDGGADVRRRSRVVSGPRRLLTSAPATGIRSPG